MTHKTLVLGDLHAPFHHRAALQSVIKFAEQNKPDLIIQVGDLYDQYGFSKYARSLNIASPQQELDDAREYAEQMWARLRKVAGKKTKLVQMLGNHDFRAMKRTMDAMPEAEGMMNDWVKKIYTFDNVELVMDAEFVYGGVLFQHGHRSKLGDHARYNQCNTVTGHSHQGGVVYDAGVKGGHWELNAGFLGDIQSPVFSYNAQKRVCKSTLGFGYIDQYGPRFIPL